MSSDSGVVNVAQMGAAFKDYSPFLASMCLRAGHGAFYGGLFGLIIFRRMRWGKFSALYGAGFGLGMCAPTVTQLKEEFFADAADGINSTTDLSLSPNSDEEFYRELDLIKQEINLRNKFRH